MVLPSSELRSIQQVQRLAPGFYRRHQRLHPRQQACKVEPSSAKLGAIELFIAFTGLRRPGHQRPHVGIGHVTERVQVLHRSRPDLIRVTLSLVQQPVGQLIELAQRLLQRLGELALPGASTGDELADLIGEQFVIRTAAGHHLAPHQVRAWIPLVPS